MVAAHSTLAPCSRALSKHATACSISPRLDETRLAAKSGTRLKVLCAVGQYQRRIHKPSGRLRWYLPHERNPHLRCLCSGHCERLAFCHALRVTYSSLVSSDGNRSCTFFARGPRAWVARRAPHSPLDANCARGRGSLAVRPVGNFWRNPHRY